MSKELTPIKALEKIKNIELSHIEQSRVENYDDDYDYYYYKVDDGTVEECYADEIEIIEVALNEKVSIENRLDEIFENHNIKSFTELNERLCDYNELKFDDDIKQKKLKALDIIKDEFEIMFNDKEQTINFQSVEKPYSHIRFSLTRIIKNKEKYELLKEILQ